MMDQKLASALLCSVLTAGALCGCDDREGTGGLFGEQQTIVSPSDGDEANIGGVFVIAWIGIQDSQVYVEYSTDGGASWTPVADEWGGTANPTNNNGYYRWRVTGPESDGCQVRVRPAYGWDWEDQELYSDFFRIVSGTAGAAFTTETFIDGTSHGGLAWGDYDMDSDLDLAVEGQSQSGVESNVYQYDGTSFGIHRSLSTPVAGRGSIAWGDYNRDGLIDLAVAGEDSMGSSRLRVYRTYTSATFEFANDFTLGILSDSAIAWGDYDNDGDLDIVHAGDSGGLPVARFYKYTGSNFLEDTSQSVTGVRRASVAWGDFNNDGWLDLAIAGLDQWYSPVLSLYQNNGGVLSYAQGLSYGICRGSLAWGDLDRDGDLDLVACGATSEYESYWPTTNVYRNEWQNSYSFYDMGTSLPGVAESAIALGDANGDGSLDVALSGLDHNSTRITRVYTNADGAGGYFLLAAEAEGLRGSALAWGDYNRDGKLDLAVSGEDVSYSPRTMVLTNTAGGTNNPPAPPQQIWAFPRPVGIVFKWTPGSDATTPEQSLSYNVRVGSGSNQINILSPMADVGSGRRLIPALGNAQLADKKILAKPAPGTYYYSVQSIDASYAASGWSAEKSVEMYPRVTYPAGGETLFGKQRIYIHWKPYGLGKFVDISLTTGAAGGTSLASGIDNNGFYRVTLPNTGTYYYIRINTSGDASNYILSNNFTFRSYLSSDGDSMDDYWESMQFGSTIRTDNMDYDNDYLVDHQEFLYASSPIYTDTDNDGLEDNAEIIYATDPNNPDTDGDSVYGSSGDAQEVGNYSDPLVPDEDYDGLPDGWEIAHFGNIYDYDSSDDPDRDNWPNGAEWAAQFDPNINSTYPDGTYPNDNTSHP
jgi:hypothetical protein